MIKKILVLTAILCLPLLSSAQNFSFVEGDLVEKTIGLSEFEAGETKITNLSDADVVYEWEMITFDNPFGWDFSICDYTVCYTGGETTGTMASVPGGSETAFIRANIYATVAGVGTYQFVVWDQAIPSEKDTVTIIMTAEGPAAGISESQNLNKLSVSSTVNNSIVLSNIGDNAITYSFLNINGQVLMTDLLSAGEQGILDGSNFNAGVYFIQYTDALNSRKTIKVMLR